MTVFALNCNTLGISRFAGPSVQDVAVIDNAIFYMTASAVLSSDPASHLDSGTPIAAHVETGDWDGNSPRMKRSTYMGVDATAASRLLVTVTYNTNTPHGTNKPLVHGETGTGTTLRAIKLPRGVKFNTVRVKIANQAGSGFDVSGLRLATIELNQ